MLQTLCRLLAEGNSPGVLVPALLTISQLARIHRDNYEAIAKGGAYAAFRRLLAHPDPAVRSRVCNLLGNMCRHSGYFYASLERNALLPPLIERCQDSDRSTRKFACFAIGNAGETSFWPPSLKSLLVLRAKAVPRAVIKTGHLFAAHGFFCRNDQNFLCI